MDFFYRRSLTLPAILLLPLSWIFKSLVTVRRFLYRHKIIRSFHFPVPIIIVGNITVGGTGKTPLVIWLAHFLKTKGFNPGIVTRGVGGKKQVLPMHVTHDTAPHVVGDEAVLLKERTGCPLVVCIDRVAAVKDLLAHSDCDVVITDDGLQHYRLKRDIEIAVMDAERQLGNRCFLPAGPLRESSSRLKEVDFVVQHGDAQPGILAMQLTGDDVVQVIDRSVKIALRDFTQRKVHAVAGIGHPNRFFAVLRAQGFEVIEHVFPDHHLYCFDDFQFNDALPIMMTEKDAVKCRAFADQRFWYLPVDAKLDKVFEVALLAKLYDIPRFLMKDVMPA
jgi:tetraacyldisaccharide 4'-kinase